jgi:hypothetical protein
MQIHSSAIASLEAISLDKQKIIYAQCISADQRNMSGGFAFLGKFLATEAHFISFFADIPKNEK